jgi:transcriptional regulator with XRE-family HTH domain
MPSDYGLMLPKLKHMRMRKAMTQLELAKLAGVARATVNRAERGEIVSFANVRKLAAALGVSVEQLQDDEDDERAAVA